MRRYYLSTITKWKHPYDNGIHREATIISKGGNNSLLKFRPDLPLLEFDNSKVIVMLDSPLPISMAGVELITDNLTEPSSALKKVLAKESGLNLKGNTLPTLLYEIVGPYLIPSKRDGKKRILLNGVVWGDQKLRPGRGSITESFAGTGATFGSDLAWTEVSGGWSHTTGIGYLDDSGFHAARCDTDLTVTDHYSLVDLTTLGSDYQSGVMLRFAAGAFDGYGVVFANDSKNIILYEITGGSDATLAEDASGGTIPGTVKGVIEGSDLDGYWDDVWAVGASDSTYSTQTQVGCVAYKGGGADVGFDNWEAGPLGGGGTPAGALTGAAGVVTGAGAARLLM